MAKKILLILVFLLILLISNFKFLLLLETPQEKIIFFCPQEFTLTYLHSVEKTPVTEKFIIKPLTGKLLMTETSFQSYGSGLPLETKNFSHTDGKFILQDMNISLKELRIRVARTPGQTLFIRNQEILLAQLSSPGQLLTVKAISISDLFFVYFKLDYFSQVTS